MIKNIRNFSIVAHIDHGKSTLADRMIELYCYEKMRNLSDRMLDSMDLEKERGITIKAQTVKLRYKRRSTDYIMNLMDTPGHVDFSYEVSRCLSACEGSILLVDATQGIEAQTLANAYKAIDQNNVIIPVLNKIDLHSADVDGCIREIEDIIGYSKDEILQCSAKTGVGIDSIMEAIIDRIPHPEGILEAPLKAMLVDAWYDVYHGVIVLIRVINGKISKGDKIKMVQAKSVFEVSEVGIFVPKTVSVDSLEAGDVGFIKAGIKNVSDCLVGDTIHIDKKEVEPLSGFKKVRPVVFSSLYPVSNDDYSLLLKSVQKLCLNDSSVNYVPEKSGALGSGLRCGFLGLLHMEIFQERLIREFSVDLIATAPSVVYKVNMKNGQEIEIKTPADMPDTTKIVSILEPITTVSISIKKEHVGVVMELCRSKRGVEISSNFQSYHRVSLVYKIPFQEIIFDFDDKLKSVTNGYGSFDWEISSYESSDIVKVSILLNGEVVDHLAFLSHRSTAEKTGRSLCLKLKDVIPKHMFQIPIQAGIGGKIIARETIPAVRKDVTAKCYGGDITRKRKLLEKQKAGKKKMKMIGSVEVPQSAFLSIFNIKK